MDAREKRLPLGKSDFAQVRREGMYYVDKTEYIARLEEYGCYSILNRPRRFGKSLFLSALEYYYDRNTTDEEFEQLFKGLYIYDHRTENAQRYLMLKLDFSKVKPKKSYEQTEKFFDDYLTDALHEFVRKYSDVFGEASESDIYNAETRWERMMFCIEMILSRSGHHIYLVIDEYDNFTNTIMSESLSQYMEITHSSGFLRSFFKMCKTAVIDRILLVGIAPVTHDDLTSGMGYCYPIGMQKMFNGILGFGEGDVREIVEYYGKRHDFGMSTDEIVADMKPWYDNYCFSPFSVGEERIYNTDAVLMYIHSLITTGMPPQDMVDQATAIDWKKIELISRKDNDRVINKLYDDGEYVTTLVPRFDMNRINDPNIFPSLLYYFGLATIKEVRRGRHTLTIPNNNVRMQFYTRMIERYGDLLDREYLYGLGETMSDMADSGEWKHLFALILKKWKDVSSVRQTIQGERAMQSFVMALLSLSNNYILRPELELSKGYADIVLFPNFIHYPDIEHSFIIELKVANAKASEKEIEEVWDEAARQAREYASDAMIPKLARESKVHKCVIVMRGWEIERMEEI